MKAKSIRGISLKQVLPEVKDILDRGRHRDDFMDYSLPEKSCNQKEGKRNFVLMPVVWSY